MTTKTAEKLAEKSAEMPGHGQSYAAFVRGQSYATDDWSAADAAGAWVAWGWIEQDENPDDDTLASYLGGLNITSEDIAAIKWLAGQAGTDSESFVDEAVAAAKDCWMDHWREVEEDRDRQSALDEDDSDSEDENVGPLYTITVTDSMGEAWDITGDLPGLAMQLLEIGYSGASITVRDEQGSVRGWVSAGDWRAI